MYFTYRCNFVHYVEQAYDSGEVIREGHMDHTEDREMLRENGYVVEEAQSL